MLEWSFEKFTQAILLFLDQSVIFTLPAIQLNHFKHKMGTSHGMAVAQAEVQMDPMLFAVSGPWSDYCVNPSR